MRHWGGLLFLVLVLAAQPAQAGPGILSDEELDTVTAQGSAFFPFDQSLVSNLTTFANVPITVNTIVAVNVNENPVISVCGFCPGSQGPVINSVNPIQASPITVSTANAILNSVRNPTLTFRPFSFSFP